MAVVRDSEQSVTITYGPVHTVHTMADFKYGVNTDVNIGGNTHLSHNMSVNTKFNRKCKC